MTSSRTAFSGNEFDEAYPPGIQYHYWMQGRCRIVARLIAAATKISRPTVLDIGCGRGIMVDYLRKSGMIAYGCDLGHAQPISDSVAPYLYYGTDASAIEPGLAGQTDVILLLDVLEHLEKPASLLASVARHFENCRYVLATFPARMELWSNYDDYYRHYLRYDQEAVDHICPDGVFTVQRTGYMFHLLYLPARLMALMKWDRATTIRAPSNHMRWVHYLLGRYFAFEQRVLPDKLFGTSLLALLERPPEYPEAATSHR